MLREVMAYATYQNMQRMLDSEIQAIPDRKDETISEYFKMLGAMCRQDPDLASIVAREAGEKNTDALECRYLGFDMYEVRVAEGNIEFPDQVDGEEMLEITLAMLHTKLDMRYGGTRGLEAFGSKRKYFRQEFSEQASAKYISNMQMKRAETLIQRRRQEPESEQSGEIFIGDASKGPAAINYAAALTPEREAARERKEQEYRKLLDALTF